MISWTRRLAVLGAVSGIVSLAVGAGIYLLEGQSIRGTRFLLAGIVLLGLYVLVDPRAVGALFTNRGARFGSLNVILSIGALAAMVLANLVVARGAPALDLSWSHINTLAPASIEAAQRTGADLEVIGFFSQENAAKRDAEGLLGLYRAQSGHFKIRFEDPDRDPAEVRQFNVSSDGSVVLRYRQRIETLTPGHQKEGDVTAALVRLESDRVPMICWAVGEGERDLNNGDARGYSAVRDQIVRLNYKFQDVFLTGSAQLPAGCDVLAIVGPQQPLTEEAINVVTAFVARGGRLLLAVDPWFDLSSENQILKPYGASFSGGLVVETDADHVFPADSLSAVVVANEDAAAMRGLTDRRVVFPLSTRINVAPSEGIAAQEIASTTSGSYEVATPRPVEQIDKRPQDRTGPFKLMETLQRSTAGGVPDVRLMLVGTTSLGENQVMNNDRLGVHNPDLLQASLRWLAGEDNQVSIPAKPSRSQRLVLDAAAAQVNVVVSLVVFPGLIALVGLLAWWRRASRH